MPSEGALCKSHRDASGFPAAYSGEGRLARGKSACWSERGGGRGRLRPGAAGEGWAPVGEHVGCGGNGHRIQCSAAAFESMVLMLRAHWRWKRLPALD